MYVLIVVGGCYSSHSFWVWFCVGNSGLWCYVRETCGLGLVYGSWLVACRHGLGFGFGICLGVDVMFDCVEA